MQAVSSADTRGRWWANEARDAAGGRAARSKGDQAGRRWRRRRAVYGRHTCTCLHRSQQLCEATGEVTRPVHDNMEGTRPRRKALPARWPYQSDNVSISERCARAWFDRRSRAPWAGLAGHRPPDVHLFLLYKGSQHRARMVRRKAPRGHAGRRRCSRRRKPSLKPAAFDAGACRRGAESAGLRGTTTRQLRARKGTLRGNTRAAGYSAPLWPTTHSGRTECICRPHAARGFRRAA